jgi:hypothetical protein
MPPPLVTRSAHSSTPPPSYITRTYARASHSSPNFLPTSSLTTDSLKQPTRAASKIPLTFTLVNRHRSSNLRNDDARNYGRQHQNRQKKTTYFCRRRLNHHQTRSIGVLQTERPSPPSQLERCPSCADRSASRERGRVSIDRSMVAALLSTTPRL